MTMPLSWLIDLDAWLPPDAVFMARTDLHQTRLLGFQPVNLEAVTGIGLGMFGRRAAVRHRSCATVAFLDLMTLAGLRVEETTLRYDTGEEAHALARQLVQEGHRFLSAYPMPPALYDDSALLVPNSLWHDLNAKSRLHLLVPPQNLAPRHLVNHAQARPMTFTFPVWLKVAGDAATGWGYAVRHCADSSSYQAALDELEALDPKGTLIMESHIKVRRSWCACILVSPDQVIFAGCAEQIFDLPGKQSGSLIDANDAPSSEMATLMTTIGERARQAGFIGIAGCDVGETDEGQLVAFDPNFRLNASSAQVLLHASATARTGAHVTQSVTLRSQRRFPEMTARLERWVACGRFVPTRGLDAHHLAAAQGISTIAGFVVEHSRASATDTMNELQSLMVT